ncbi:MAG: magnesium transporter [Eubacteriales bacterium]|nr:magnesium transporter [Eubacteriales bacterium]MDD4134849.1 magnesium transporter [Eubacteriales bacterium]
MDWEKIQETLDSLMAQKRHGQLRGALMMINPVDIAEYMKKLDRENLLLLFRILPKDISAEVFSYMDSDQREALVDSIADKEITALISDMFVDDAVDFLEELPANAVKRVLQNTDPHTRAVINQFLKYPENSAGSLMTIEYCEFAPEMSVQDALTTIMQTGVDKETVYTLYLVDKHRKLVGTVPLHKALVVPVDTPLTKLVDPTIIAVNTLDDQEVVADTVRRYHLLSIPVVDGEGRMVGIITSDDIMDVIEEENTEDFERMSGLAPAEEPYFKTSLFKLAWNRLPWLMILMLASVLSGAIISKFESVLAVNILLSASIPMLMNTGGNCGQQASTLMVRGIALGEVQFTDLLKAIWTELRVGIVVGFALSMVTFLRLILLNQASVLIALTISFSLYATVVIAKSIGCALPLIAQRFKIDPALAASPLITTLVDAASLLIFFSVASGLVMG